MLKDRKLLVACVLLVALVGSWAAGLRYNASPSVPLGVYRAHAFSKAEVKRGSYVCLRAASPAAPPAVQETHWAFDRAVLLKRVAGLPGDEIEEGGGGLTINGAPLARSLRCTRDSLGHDLPHPELPVRLQRDELWLASDNSTGFDSRYFGPVHVAALSCIAEPLWTF